MPARSRRQQRFFGLVRGVQKGTVPMNSVDDRILNAAKKMTPKDVGEFASTKHYRLPEVKDSDERPAYTKMSSVRMLATTDAMSKLAGIDAKVRTVEKSLRQMAQVRRNSLSDLNKKLQKDNENVRKELQQTQQQAQQMQQESQAAMSSMQAPGPTPPPAQTPYGAMLAQQQMQAEQQQKQQKQMQK
jgi:hypothetical protein